MPVDVLSEPEIYFYSIITLTSIDCHDFGARAVHDEVAKFKISK